MIRILSRPSLPTWLIAILAAVIMITFLPAVSAQGRGGAPPCPENVAASTTEDGIHLSWNFPIAPGERDFAGESKFLVYRAAGEDVDPNEEWLPERNQAHDDDRFTLIASIDADSGPEEYTDGDVQDGVSYAYIVTFDDGVESERCPIVEATAIPFFGAPLLGAFAVVGGVGAYAWLGRRRQQP